MFVARFSVSVPVVFGVLVSVATVACGGSGSSGSGGDGGAGGLGTGSGATATPQSSCAALSKWATGCSLAVDEKACQAQAAGHTAAQLQAATDCTNTKSCDQNTVDACIQKALASKPPANSGGGLGSSGAVPDAGGGGGGGGGGTCETCTRASCANEVAACEAMPACVTLYSCVAAAAGDEAQVQACVDQDDSGLTKLQAIAQCQNAKCSAVCQ